MGICLPFARWRPPSSPQQSEKTEKAAGVANVDVAVWLHKRSKLQRTEEQAEESATDQPLLAVEHVRRRYRARYQQSFWPSARMDTERERWVDTFAALLVLTPTPMEKLLAQLPGNAQLAGGGKRASSIQSRVSVVRSFLKWFLHLSPARFPHTEYSRTHHSEPCNRGALKNTQPACAFLEKAAGVPEAEKHAPQLSTT